MVTFCDLINYIANYQVHGRCQQEDFFNIIMYASCIQSHKPNLKSVNPLEIYINCDKIHTEGHNGEEKYIDIMVIPMVECGYNIQFVSLVPV